ncbi:hypothetical protein IFM89_027611 [Coptis chinensis]|uniref:Uncharacterized protein n=1 Tax=Coptis chinensis TaxID=261450 RepID=A0A835M9U7_9MAGN|nr:hypothetical protein IFM89_027611 [Coptis chinensis]
MGGYWQWVGVIQSKFAKSPRHRTIIVNQINNTKTVADEEEKYPKENGDHQSLKKQEFSLEDITKNKDSSILQGLSGKTGISSTEEPSKGPSAGSWGSGEETVTDCPTLHACPGTLADNQSTKLARRLIVSAYAGMSFYAGIQ